MTNVVRKIQVLLLPVLFMAASPVWGETQFWVSVGSYMEQGNALTERDRAVGLLSESFSVVGTSTDRGYFYRVAAGPFLTRELAEDRVRAARDAGFPGAWLWVDESEAFSTQIDPASSEALRSGDVLPGILPDEEYPADPSETYSSGDALNDEGIMTREKIPDLVEEPPPGFQLNKLRRDT